MASRRELAVHLEDAHGLTDDPGSASEPVAPERDRPVPQPSATSVVPNSYPSVVDPTITSPWGPTAARGTGDASAATPDDSSATKAVVWSVVSVFLLPFIGTAMAFINAARAKPGDPTGRARIARIIAGVGVVLWLVIVVAAALAPPEDETTGVAANTAVETTQAPADASAGPPAQAPDGAVPDVVGMDLQSAQDTLQASGYRHLESIDYTGRGRNQVVDSNWIVVDMLPTPGERVSTAYKVTLFVVKEGEQ